MAVGRPGVPSWNDAAGDQQQQRPGEHAQAAPDDWDSAGTVGGSSRMQAALSRLLAYGLWGLLALALVVSLVNCAGRPSAAPPAAGGAGSPAPPVPPPGGCAELTVTAWLAGDTELLADIPGMPRADPEPGRRRAAQTYTASATPGDHAWAYLVGAEVEVREDSDDDTDPADGPEGGQWRPAGIQFFRVTMIPTDSGGCQGWRPAALPAQVPAPLLAGDPNLPYEVSLPTSGTELSQTMEAFFSGMLTGAENLERYVAPGVYVPPLVPPPYEQVSLTELRAFDDVPAAVPPDGTVVQLLTTVATADEDLPLVYPVTVAVRGGRWEVVALDPLVETVVQETTGTEGPAGPGESTNGG